jgi:hypothetical protein
MLVTDFRYDKNKRLFLNSNLPLKTTETSSAKNKLLLPAVLLIAGGILGVVFNHFLVISIVFLTLGLALFLAKNLVKKSLELSSGPVGMPLDKILADLKHEVAQTKYLSHQGKLGEKAHAQAIHLDSSYQFLMKILVQKFSPNELTFDRYETAINEAVLNLQGNLKHTSNLLTLLDHQDPLSSSSLDEVNNILTTNHEMLSNLDALAEALKEINRGEVVKKDFEESLDKLKLLAERAQAYTTKK